MVSKSCVHRVCLVCRVMSVRCELVPQAFVGLVHLYANFTYTLSVRWTTRELCQCVRASKSPPVIWGLHSGQDIGKRKRPLVKALLWHDLFNVTTTSVDSTQGSMTQHQDDNVTPPSLTGKCDKTPRWQCYMTITQGRVTKHQDDNVTWRSHRRKCDKSPRWQCYMTITHREGNVTKHPDDNVTWPSPTGKCDKTQRWPCYKPSHTGKCDKTPRWQCYMTITRREMWQNTKMTMLHNHHTQGNVTKPPDDNVTGPSCVTLPSEDNIHRET